MSPYIFAQVITWTSGFYNFVLPILCMLLCLYLVDGHEVRSIGKLVLIGCVGFAGQLFVEHSSVVHMIIAAVMMTVFWKKGRKTQMTAALTWLGASLAGLAVMILVPMIFHQEQNLVDGYRHTAFESMTVFIEYVKTGIYFIINTYASCFALWTILALCATLLFAHTKTHKKRTCIMVGALNAISIGAIWAFSIMQAMSANGILFKLIHLMAIVGMVQICAVLTIAIIASKDRALLWKLAGIVLLAGMSLAPFLLVRPFGERCILLSYIFMILFAAIVIDYTAEKIPLSTANYLRKAGMAFVIGMAICLTFEYFRMFEYAQKRDAYIEDAMLAGETEITIFEYPTSYSFITLLVDEYYYYETPGDIEFVIVSYAEWLNLTEN